MMLNSFLKLAPSYRDYVWGGDRLRPGHSPTAEAWVVWEGDVIESGHWRGKPWEKWQQNMASRCWAQEPHRVQEHVSHF